MDHGTRKGRRVSSNVHVIPRAGAAAAAALLFGGRRQNDDLVQNGTLGLAGSADDRVTRMPIEDGQGQGDTIGWRFGGIRNGCHPLGPFLQQGVVGKERTRVTVGSKPEDGQIQGTAATTSLQGFPDDPFVVDGDGLCRRFGR